MELVELEVLWAEQLKSVSVIFQLEFDDADAQRALSNLGRHFDADRDEYIQRQWSASLLVGINHAASRGYNQGELWSSIFKGLGLQDSPVNRKKVSICYQYALELFGLERFEHPLSNIGEMLLHTGIPVVSLSRLVTKLLRVYDEVDNLTGHEFNSIVRAYEDWQVQGKGLDKPTYHFIRQAGFIADDFVDKCIDVLDDLQDGDYDENGGMGLPPRVIEEIVRVVKDLRVNKPKATKSKRTTNAKPAVRWDPYFTDNELHVVLPHLSDAIGDKIVWSLDGNGVSKTAVTSPGLTGRDLAQHFVLSSEIPEISITAAYDSDRNIETTANWSIRIYPEREQLVVFDADGFLVPGQSPLEPGVYTVMFPAVLQGSDVDLAVDANIPSTEVAPPSGWAPSLDINGWKAYLVDLTNTSKIQLSNGSRRFVSKLKRPKILVEGAVAVGVFTSGSEAVLSHLPQIELPPLHGATPTWTVLLRDEGRSKVWEHTFQTAEDSLRVDLATLCDLELFGAFELIVTSSVLGASTRQQIFVASGLKAESEPNLRFLKQDSTGLDEAKITVSRGSEVFEITLVAKESEGRVIFASADGEQLVIKPKHESIELFNKKSGNRSKWITPARMHIEDLSNLELTFRGFDESGGKLVAIWGATDNARVHQLRQFSASGTSRFQLSELVDDAVHHGAFRLTFIRKDGSSLTVANCYNKKLAEFDSYDLESQTLVMRMSSSSAPDYLVAYVQPVYAKWVLPVALDVVSDSVQIPRDIVAYGSFDVALAISPPWAPAGSNEVEKSFIVEVAQSEIQSSGEMQIVRWLATGESPEEFDRLDPQIYWQIIIDEAICSKFVNRAAVKSQAQKMLRQDPNAALAAYPITSSRADTYLRDFFLAGLVDVPSIADTTKLVSAGSKPFLCSLFLADAPDSQALSEMAAIAQRSWGLSIESFGEDETAIVDALLNAIKRASMAYLSLCNFINGAVLPSVNPCLWNDELFESFLLTHQLPRGQFFSDGTLVQIFKSLKVSSSELVAYLKPAEITKMVANLEEIQSKLPSQFRELAMTRPFLDDASFAKQDQPGIHVGEAIYYLTKVPAICLRLTLLARLAARGDASAQKLWLDSQSFYKTLSIQTPELVEHDLVISELYLAIGANNGND